MKNLLTILCACFLSAAVAGGNDKPEHILTIVTEDGREHEFPAEELLARPDVENVVIANTPAYPKDKLTVKAIRFHRLMEDFRVSPEATMEFMATDGFTSPMDAALVMNSDEDNSIAYLAIEDPDNQWPPHRSGKGTSGPFYLFWINPELSGISREEWPYKVDTISINKSVRERYAGIVPPESFGEEHPVARGFRVFMKNCMACHKLNRVGSGIIGPDLNYPMSPVEYFRDGVLRQFIRQPQSVRLYPGSKMIGFGEGALSDTELDQLIAYLEYMAERDK
ncbi:MAG: cytochrome c [Gammaproteobacteria bacterium]